MAVRDGEVAFVRRLRAGLARSAGSQPLSPHELARLETRVYHSLRGGAIAAAFTPRFMALAAASAVCVVWFVARRPSVQVDVPATAAYSLEVPESGRGLREIELKALLKSFPGEASALSPALLADFDQLEDLSRVTFVGAGAPSLSTTSRSGRRSLRTSAGPAESPVEVILGVPARLQSRQVQTVSAWVLARSSAVEVALDLGAGSAPARRVEPGEWRWVTFTVPAAPLTEVRLRLTGAGPVLLDQVELWCNGASHGG